MINSYKSKTHKNLHFSFLAFLFLVVVRVAASLSKSTEPPLLLALLLLLLRVATTLDRLMLPTLLTLPLRRRTPST